MNADWEILLPRAPGRDDDFQHAAAAAFDEIDRIEQDLSRFIPSSDISRINMAKIGRPVSIGPACFEILELSRQICDITGSAFDPGGIHSIAIDSTNHTITRHSPLTLDLGAIGKGYALDQAATLLQDWGITNALVHAARSTVLAIGGPFSIHLRHPFNDDRSLGTIQLTSESLSGSAAIKKPGHIKNPATNQSSTHHLATWARCPCAAESDALSTAFMNMPTDAIQDFCHMHAHVHAWLLPVMPMSPSPCASI